MKLAERKHQQILLAAEQAFAEWGVEGTSMDKIATLAKVSKRTVYNHFSSKAQLLQALLDEQLTQLKQAGDIHFDASKPVREQLAQIARQEADLLTSARFIRLARTVLMQLLKEPELLAQLEAQHLSCEHALCRFLQAATQVGALQIDDIEFASKQFVYHLKSFLFYPRLYSGITVTEQYKADIIARTLNMFLAQYQPTDHRPPHSPSSK